MATTTHNTGNRRIDMRSSNLKSDILRLPEISARLAARHIMKHELETPLWRDGIGTDSNRHVRLIIDDTDTLSLALARQAALLCHFPNFDEETGANRTILTFMAKSASDFHELESVFREIIDSRMLGNLPDHCNVRFCAPDSEGRLQCSVVSGEDSYLDIAIEIVAAAELDIDTLLSQLPDTVSTHTTIMSRDILHAGLKQLHQGLTHCLLPENLPDESECERYLAEVDFTRAMLVNKVYSISTGLREINNFSSFDAADYNMSLQRLCDEITPATAIAAWDTISGPDRIEMILSNLYCGDCIDTKLASMRLRPSDFVHDKVSGLSRLFPVPDRRRQSQARRVLEKNLVTLAKTEHARWNVEKLLLGYAPYTKEEHYADEQLIGTARAASRRHKKKVEKHHIDICSHRQLMHIDPESLKYDCFLTLAIDRILTLERDFHK